MAKAVNGTSELELSVLNNYQRDLNWFYDNYPMLKQKYSEKFVVVKGEKVVLDLKDQAELKSEARRKRIDLAVSVVKFIPKKDIELII